MKLWLEVQIIADVDEGQIWNSKVWHVKLERGKSELQLGPLNQDFWCFQDKVMSLERLKDL